MIVAGLLVVVAPALSVARAVSLYVPAAPTFHWPVYGAVVSSLSFVAPLKNSTRVTLPSASAAVAASATLAGDVKLAPFDGDVSDTVGD